MKCREELTLGGKVKIKMNCKECKELMVKGPDNCTSAEISSVVVHITDCKKCWDSTKVRDAASDKFAHSIDDIVDKMLADPECIEQLVKCFSEKGII